MSAADRAALDRLSRLARVLDRPTPTQGTGAAAAVESVVDLRDTAEVWLVLAALTGSIPHRHDAVAARRAARTSGGAGLLAHVARLGPAEPRRRVEVQAGAVWVDVTQAVSTRLVTGIQRVTLETARRWVRDHGATPVTWTSRARALRPPTPDEHARLTGERTAKDHSATTVVPWRGTLLLPELADDPERIGRTAALVRHSRSHVAAIGYDCVPLMSPETAQPGFVPLFYRHLDALARADVIVAISRSAALEYTGWTKALTGIRGPRVVDVPLPAVAPEPSDAGTRAAREAVLHGDLPTVLVVGSHEPRKNHLAVLEAAERAWAAGDDFGLTFVGGNAWSSGQFDREVRAMAASGRPVRVVRSLPDDALWAAYRLARCTLFPSLSEGFGLPVAESLAAGTPVVTSGHGSMREIGAGGGALFVDPRDPDDLARALRTLLNDDERLERLRTEAATQTRGSWDAYAESAWAAATRATT